MSFLDIFTISPLQRPKEISQNVSGLNYVGRGAGYKIHICAKLYCLGRAKVFSSVATDFGSWTMYGFAKYQLIYDVIRRNGGAFIISRVTGVKILVRGTPIGNLYFLNM